MGDREKASLRLQFNPQIRLELHGATITSDAGLLAFRELDDALDLTPIASDYLQESRTGRNIRHHLVPLLRQSIYSRLAGYDDTNDAERLSQDPAMRVVVGWQGSDRNAARTNTMSRFETETLTQEDNLKGLALMNPHFETSSFPWGTMRNSKSPIPSRRIHSSTATVRTPLHMARAVITAITPIVPAESPISMASPPTPAFTTMTTKMMFARHNKPKICMERRRGLNGDIPK